MSDYAYFDGENVSKLQVLLEEVTRAKPGSPKARFVQPDDDTVRVLSSKFHHVVYGRRGTGKSSLLRHIEGQLRGGDRIVAWVDQENLKALSYPDVLVAALAEIFSQFADQLAIHYPTPKRPWYKFGRAEASVEQQLIADLKIATLALNDLKRMPDSSEVEWTEVTFDESTSQSTRTGDLSVNAKAVSIGGSKGRGQSSKKSKNLELAQRYTASKSEHLERALSTYRSLMTRVGDVVGDAYVILDDFYHLEYAKQPNIAGYFHRAVKDSGVWLKFGSIQLWTRLYAGGLPPIGMQVPHDLKDRTLDRNLQQFPGTKRFLEGILANLGEECGVEMTKLFTEGALDRLILASGGVPRDYIGLVALSISEAKSRGMSTKAGSNRVSAEDVNKAAGRTVDNKLSDMQEDAGSEWVSLHQLVLKLTAHCRVSKSACFLIDTSDVDLVNKINRLQNMRFVHHVASNESPPQKQTARYNVYVLDVSQLAAQRAWQVDFMGWTKREGRRARKLIFREGAEVAPVEGVVVESAIANDDAAAVVEAVE
ncbi:hypothetical protein [Brachybacterium sp. UNK5269]|uniref:hypothetical protein n=1 Tax=Brachybacterium sp. UNK5269 TaxID=3408576 RepID=UPI003BB0A337